jgi:hypothetical protein
MAITRQGRKKNTKIEADRRRTWSNSEARVGDDECCSEIAPQTSSNLQWSSQTNTKKQHKRMGAGTYLVMSTCKVWLSRV